MEGRNHENLEMGILECSLEQDQLPGRHEQMENFRALGFWYRRSNAQEAVRARKRPFVRATPLYNIRSSRPDPEARVPLTLRKSELSL